MRGTKVVSIVLYCLCVSLGSAEPIHQGQTFTYDSKNSVSFQDVGRKEEANEVEFGRYVRLHITCDGKTYDADLTDSRTATNAEGYVLVSPQVKEIRYRDKYRIWVISREGHIADSATLYDLQAQKILVQYLGIGFVLSPSGKNMAFIRRIYGAFQDAVFVDSTMVFPVLKQTDLMSWDHRKWDQVNGPRTTDGGSIQAVATKGEVDYEETDGPIRWLDESRIQFSAIEIPHSILSTSQSADRLQHNLNMQHYIKIDLLNREKVSGLREKVTISGIETEGEFSVATDRLKIEKNKHADEIRTNDLQF